MTSRVESEAHESARAEPSQSMHAYTQQHAAGNDPTYSPTAISEATVSKNRHYITFSSLTKLADAIAV